MQAAIGESRRWSAEPVQKAKQNPHTHTFPHAQAHTAASRQGGDLPAARVETRVNLVENENHCGKREGSWLFFFLPQKKIRWDFYLPQVLFCAETWLWRGTWWLKELLPVLCFPAQPPPCRKVSWAHVSPCPCPLLQRVRGGRWLL